MNGQWQPPQLPAMPGSADGAGMMGRMAGTGAGRVGPMSPGGAGNADVLPSSEELEIKAMGLGMPPLEQCLRRCPRCLQGVPIRSMMCSHCQYSIPVSAKAMARREMKEAAQQGSGINGGCSYAGNVGPAMSYGRSGGSGYGNSPMKSEGLGGGGGSDSDGAKPRQKRRRQSTKKGNMTATEEELAELDEGLEEDEPVSWKKTSGQRRTGETLGVGRSNGG